MGRRRGSGAPVRGAQVQVLNVQQVVQRCCCAARASVSYSAARTLKSSMWRCASRGPRARRGQHPRWRARRRAPRGRSAERSCRRALSRDRVEARVDVQHVRLAPARGGDVEHLARRGRRHQRVRRVDRAALAPVAGRRVGELDVLGDVVGRQHNLGAAPETRRTVMEPSAWWRRRRSGRRSSPSSFLSSAVGCSGG